MADALYCLDIPKFGIEDKKSNDKINFERRLEFFITDLEMQELELVGS